MKPIEKQYFRSLREEINRQPTVPYTKSTFHYPLMPSQYSYIHNLKTGAFEEVRNVKNILGYEDKEFTLEKYYSILHPFDRELIFETTKRNINTANEAKMLQPFSCQLTIMCRIQKKCGQYANIIRFSTVLSASEKVIKTFSICTDITDLDLRTEVSCSFSLQGSKPYDNKLLLYQLSKKRWKILTPRELQILELIYKGHRSEEISCLLSISRLTVNKHRQNIIRKTNAKNIQEVINEIFSTHSDLFSGNTK